MGAHVSTELHAARVRVPCSTSNLGTGYDTLGLALDLYLEASFEPTGDALVVRRTGTLAHLSDDGAPDLVAETFLRSLEPEGLMPGGLLTLSSAIPVARGLGSSAAAVLAGADLALAVLGRPRADDDVFRIAFEREGHGDNAAPCLFGGLQAVVQAPEGPQVIHLDLSPDVGFAYAAPSRGMSTAVARSVLPPQVSLAMAVRQLGRLTSLVRGLATGDGELIRTGVEDELHVPHRLPMIDGGADATAAGYEAGAWAVTLSGAGSGLLAMCALDRTEDVSNAMRSVFSQDHGDEEAVCFVLRPDLEGLVRL